MSSSIGNIASALALAIANVSQDGFCRTWEGAGACVGALLHPRINARPIGEGLDPNLTSQFLVPRRGFRRLRDFPPHGLHSVDPPIYPIPCVPRRPLPLPIH